MSPSLPGLHHITAITADPQKNIDFYTGILGLRLVKLTVNFDDPGSYHLYYGDHLGHPGTILTFFAWPGAYRGRVGPSQVTAIAWAVPSPAFNYWVRRFHEHHLETQAVVTRFGQQVLRFADPDGLPLEIVAAAAPEGRPWAASPIPAEYALRGFHSVTLSEEGYETTATLLTNVMGYQTVASEGNRFRYRAGPGEGLATIVDLLCVPGAHHGGLGAGVVHHVAFRTPDDAQQQTWRTTLVKQGFNVTPVIDREYFRSIYYREPGGVLFEIATEPPGFTVDQPAAQLGTKLMLPPWLEQHRKEVTQVLPPVRLPASSTARVDEERP